MRIHEPFWTSFLTFRSAGQCEYVCVCVSVCLCVCVSVSVCRSPFPQLPTAPMCSHRSLKPPQDTCCGGEEIEVAAGAEPAAMSSAPAAVSDGARAATAPSEASYSSPRKELLSTSHQAQLVAAASIFLSRAPGTVPARAAAGWRARVALRSEFGHRKATKVSSRNTALYNSATCCCRMSNKNCLLPW
jgi:hypothetical protein